MNTLYQDIYMFMLVNEEVRYYELVDYVYNRWNDTLYQVNIKFMSPTMYFINKLVDDGVILTYMVDDKKFVKLA